MSAMRYIEFARLGKAAQIAKVKARWIVEMQVLRREREWRRLMLKVWAMKWMAWLRAKRVDALILLGVVLGSIAAECGIVYFLVTWR